MSKSIKKYIAIAAGIILIFLIWFAASREWQGNDNTLYENTKHNYSFRYHPEWNKMGEAEDDIVMLYNTENPPGDGGIPQGIKIDVMALENYDNLELDAWVEQMTSRGPEKEVINKANMKIGGEKAIRQASMPRQGSEGPPIGVYLIKDNNVILMNYLGREPDYSENVGHFESLLRSFSFK